MIYYMIYYTTRSNGLFYRRSSSRLSDVLWSISLPGSLHFSTEHGYSKARRRLPFSIISKSLKIGNMPKSFWRGFGSSEWGDSQCNLTKGLEGESTSIINERIRNTVKPTPRPKVHNLLRFNSLTTALCSTSTKLTFGWANEPLKWCCLLRRLL
jgi:hypothetical protein